LIDKLDTGGLLLMPVGSRTQRWFNL
jgi:hypothetical protein